MAYEDLINNAPVEKELEYGGQTKTVYFKQLTSGERLQLKKGQKGSVHAGESTFEVDLGDIDARNHLLLSFSNCDKDGKPVFKTAKQVADLPGTLVDALLALCGEALKENPLGN